MKLKKVVGEGKGKSTNNKEMLKDEVEVNNGGEGEDKANNEKKSETKKVRENKREKEMVEIKLWEKLQREDGLKPLSFSNLIHYTEEEERRRGLEEKEEVRRELVEEVLKMATMMVEEGRLFLQTVH